MKSKVEQIEYLRRHYNHSFPMKAKYKRSSNRIYFVGDFEDNEVIIFHWMCDKPSACAYGNAWYIGTLGAPKLINIKELAEEDDNVRR